MKNLIILVLSIGLSMANEAALQEFTTGNNLFTAAIYKEALRETQDNLLVSPFSIQTVLALTQSGAKDETANEIRRGLSLPQSPETIEAVYGALLPRLKGNEEYQLHTANKIYVKNSYPLNGNFQKVAATVYQAGIENIDFSQKVAAAQSINGWVEQQTENKIHELIDPKNLDDDTRVILINALYFKGKWSTPFETYSTRKEDFFRSAKDTVKVDTMHTTEIYNYFESRELDAKFLELPYKGQDVSMIIALPNQVNGLAALENQIERVFTLPKFSRERVSVSLPKFSFENKLQLKKLLKNLGINKAFTDEADLSGIAGNKGELIISDVIQKAFINVTESGTEAAAATAVQGVRLAAIHLDSDPKIFNADHPFIYYITTKNIILFGGRVTTPSDI